MSKPFVLHTGDALDVLKTLPDNSVDSVVTDPPYGLSEEPDILKLLRDWLEEGEHEHGSVRKGSKHCLAHIARHAIVGDAKHPQTHALAQGVNLHISLSGSGLSMARAVNFDNGLQLGDEQVDNPVVLPVGDNVLVDDSVASSAESVGNLIFHLRPLDGVSTCVGLCSCFALGDDSVARVHVRLSGWTHQTEGPTGVVTLTRAEYRAVLALDLARGAGELHPASGTDTIDPAFELVASELVGTGPGAGSLATVLEPGFVGFVDHPTDGTLPLHSRVRLASESSGTSGATHPDPGLGGVELFAADGTLFLHTDLQERLTNPTIKRRGFMSKTWDSMVPGPLIWRELFRVMKPGAHAAVFSGTRTVDLMGLALRMAGFEIRDSFSWVRGSGMPKSHNLKGDWKGWGSALKPLYEPILLVRKPLEGTIAGNVSKWGTGALNADACRLSIEGGDSGRWPPNVLFSHVESISCPHCDATGQVPGWDHLECQTCKGEGTLPGCQNLGTRRVKATSIHGESTAVRRGGVHAEYQGHQTPGRIQPVKGYADADGKEEIEAWDCVPGCPVAEVNDQSIAGGMHGAGHSRIREVSSEYQASSYHAVGKRRMDRFGDDGGASRFYYCAKASTNERAFYCKHCETVFPASHRKHHSPGVRDHSKGDIVQHPTQKPEKLMKWLTRLLTPPGGTVLDPFMGSGTTGVAAVEQGFQFIGIDLEPLYREIALLRLGDEERAEKQSEALIQQSIEEEPGGILAMFGGDE